MERKANIDEWSLGAIQRKAPQDVLVFLEVEIALLETSEDMRTFVVEKRIAKTEVLRHVQSLSG